MRHADGSISQGRIDLYRRGCFVMEAKQMEARARGTPFHARKLFEARGQAENYARALPAAEGWPPFLIVVDVGGSFDLFADFTGIGKAYLPFPDPRSNRIDLAALADPAIRTQLAAIWMDPQGLDPARRAAAATKDIADRLAELARSLERSGHKSERVAEFLMRCLFTMFAEDVELLPRDSFKDLLGRIADNPRGFQAMVTALWRDMDQGGISVALDGATLRRFNGALFRNAQALPLDSDQIGLLRDAAAKNWREVEPAIFGTLLERALDPDERHKLGAHYTPRAYVERLVIPTVIEPLREDWENVKAAALREHEAGDDAAARALVRDFHRALCDTTILDPACGSGNFLYVTLEHMKRLEGEVLDLLTNLGEDQYLLELSDHTVDPHQFLGLEKNPRAVEIAQMVIWIGFLQWHFRTNAKAEPPTPVLPEQRTIREMDAVLEWARTDIARDEKGRPITRWDGKSFRPSPTTGEPVPDETQRVEDCVYVKPRLPDWPKADFIVGNPPFVGAGPMKETLGPGYVEALRAAHVELPDSCDYVMYWWDKAARLVRAGKARSFGFITTNSIHQTFNRRVIEPHLRAVKPLSLAFAIPDHPWVDASDGADVRIAMTVGLPGPRDGVLRQVTAERPAGDGALDVELDLHVGTINPDLTIGTDVTRARALRANEALSSPGVKLHGAGFIVTPEQANDLGLGRVAGLDKHIRPYRNGRDLTTRPRDAMVIDLFGLTEDQVRVRFPAVYQWVLERVKPERDAKRGNKDSDKYAELWWLFGKPRTDLRPALHGLPRYIATVETAKHRVFQFLDATILPDNKLVAIAMDDAFALGVLSSRIHTTYALAAGGWLGVGNDPVYVKTRCFDPFPFPVASDAQKMRIRTAAERLDAHRKTQLAAHPDLTLTKLYNVLDKLRGGADLDASERTIHADGLVAVLRQLHDELDAAVAAAYGWPAGLPEAEILARVVALNAERVAEENRGLVRWLRPEYQTRVAAARRDMALDLGDAAPVAASVAVGAWPKSRVDQVAALRAVLAREARPLDVKTLAKSFKGARVDRVEEILAILVSLGRAYQPRAGVYIG